MKSINISLPESMDTYIQEQVKIHGYNSVSEYLQNLINQEQKRQANEQLEQLLLESLDSGEATEMTQQDWLDIRQAVREKFVSEKGEN
jgi:antitoxin ParD1/3/4